MQGSSLVGYSKSTFSGANAVPVDTSVFGSDTARMKVNDQDGYVARDVKTQVQTDPRFPFRLSDGGLDALGSSWAPASIPDSGLFATNGVNGNDSLARFTNVVDPLDVNRRAFKMELKQGDLTTAGHRIELSQGGVGLSIPRGKDYWVAFAFHTPSSWKTVDKDLVANPNAQHDETCVFQMHDVADGGDTNHQPNMAMTIHGGGAGRPDLSQMYFQIRDNPLANSNSNNDTFRTVWRESDYPADVWQYWVFNLRLHWDDSYKPFFKAWRRVGYTGEYKLVIDDKHANQFNNVADDYQKHGMYYYADAWTGGITARALHSKGLYLFRDDGSVTLKSVTDFMDKI